MSLENNERFKFNDMTESKRERTSEQRIRRETKTAGERDREGEGERETLPRGWRTGQSV